MLCKKGWPLKYLLYNTKTQKKKKRYVDMDDAGKAISVDLDNLMKI